MGFVGGVAAVPAGGAAGVGVGAVVCGGGAGAGALGRWAAAQLAQPANTVSKRRRFAMRIFLVWRITPQSLSPLRS